MDFLRTLKTSFLQRFGWAAFFLASLTILFGLMALIGSVAAALIFSTHAALSFAKLIFVFWSVWVAGVFVTALLMTMWEGVRVLIGDAMGRLPSSFASHGRWLLRGLLLIAYGLFCGWIVWCSTYMPADTHVEAPFVVKFLGILGFIGLCHASYALWSHIQRLRQDVDSEDSYTGGW